MKKEPVLIEAPKRQILSKKDTPGFYRLFQQTVLLVLKEQGLLDQEQYQATLDFLEKE